MKDSELILYWFSLCFYFTAFLIFLTTLSNYAILLLICYIILMIHSSLTYIRLDDRYGR